MKFMRDKKSKIAFLLIMTTLCMSIIMNFHMGTQVKADPIVLPVLYELIASIAAMMGISVSAGNYDSFQTGGNFYNIVDRWLNDKAYVGGYQTIKAIILSAQLATINEINKMTKGELLKLFIDNFATIENGYVDINNDTITDNQVITFNDVEKKNILMKDILADIRSFNFITDEDKLNALLGYPGTESQKWQYYNSSPLSITEYPNQYVIEIDYNYKDRNGIWYRPVTINTAYPDRFPTTFPFSTDYSRLLIIRNQEVYYYFIQVPINKNVYRTWNTTYNRWELKFDNDTSFRFWSYHQNNKTWTYYDRYQDRIVDSLFTVEYYPLPIYDNSSLTTVWREADQVVTELIAKGYESLSNVYNDYDIDDYRLLIASKGLTWAEIVSSNTEIRTGTGNDINEREYFKLYRYVNDNWVSHDIYKDIYALSINTEDLENGYVRIQEANNAIYTGVDDEEELINPTIEKGKGGEVVPPSILTLPDENPFTSENPPLIWDENSPSISIPKIEVIEDFLNDILTTEEKEIILTNDEEISISTPITDVIDYSPPYDDNQVVQGLGVISQWLNAIWDRIGEAIGVMTQSTTADPDPDLNEKAEEFKWPSIFICIWDVLISCIKLVLRAAVFLISLFAVPADDSLLNNNVKNSLNFFKEQSLPAPFNVSFWNVFSAVMVLMIATMVLKKANHFV